MKNIMFCIWLMLAFFILTELAQAQEFLADAGPPGKQKAKVNLKNSSRLKSESNSTPSTQFDASLSLPVHQTENSTYGLVGKTRHLHFDNLPAGTQFIPVADLYAHQYGASWAYQEEDENTWGLNVNYGSSSDKPFDGGDVQSTDMTLTRKMVETPTSYWLYFLNYSNNRSILNNIPLPGFAYLFSDAEKTKGGAVGLPFFSYWWRPNGKLFASAFILPSALQLHAGHLIAGPFQANLKLEYGQQVYMRSGRQNRKERIFYEARKIATSLKFFFSRTGFLEIEMAHVFGRSLYDGENAYEPTSERMTLPHEWPLTVALQMNF